MTTEPNMLPNHGEPPYDYEFKPDETIANRYKVIEPIGYGGFSEVYHCEDTDLTREVAVKVLIKGEGGLREARAAAHLDHKNIVQVYDIATHPDGPPIIVFKYLGGTTLEKRLSAAQHGRLQLDNATLNIIHEIAEALDYAHNMSVIHRDVKPSNVIIDTSGEAHLTDFGLAAVKLTDGERSSALTTDVRTKLSGTLPYMSPEQLRDGVPGDEKSDQYSLAVMAYEMLTGRLPYPGHDATLVYQITGTPPQPPTSINPDLPKGVEPVLLKALGKKPEERFASCTEFATSLTAAADAYVRANTQYGEAVKLVDERQWRKALFSLEALNVSAPSFRDTEKYLESVRRQVQLLELCERASQQVEQGAFREAITTIDFLIQLDSTYDVAALKQRAFDGQAKIEQTALDDLYQQAVDQYTRGEYEASVNMLGTIHQRDPKYPDARSIQADAIAQADRVRELRQLYQQGIEQMDREQWDAAVESFNALKRQEAKYRDVERQLTTAHLWARLSALLREAQDLLSQGRFADSVDKARELHNKGDSFKADEVAALEQEGLNRLHGQIVSQLSSGQYQASLATLAELQKRTDQFTDLDELSAQAHEGIRKQQLKASLDESYQQAQAHLKRYAYQDALTLWESIQARREDLDYADPYNVEGQARRGLATNFYNEAVAALAGLNPQQALDCWQQAQKVEPNYPDNQHIVERAQALKEKIDADQLRKEAEERDRLAREAAERKRQEEEKRAQLAREAEDRKRREVEEQERLKREAEARARRNKWLVRIALIVLGLIGLTVVISLVASAIAAPPPTPTVAPTATSASVAPTTAPTATIAPTQMPTDAPVPTSAPTTAPTATIGPTQVPTNVPSPTLAPTTAPVPSPTSAIMGNNIARAIQQASIFASPDPASRELLYVKVGDLVTVTGRPASGAWLYVQSAGDVAEGYVDINRFQWSGDFTALPVVSKVGFGPGVDTTTSTTPPSVPTVQGTVEGLTLDLWPLPKTSKCLANGQWSVTLFMSAHGGYGNYTYYWNGQQVGGPLPGQFTFDITATGVRTQGVGRVTSGNLQTEKILDVKSPGCP